MKTSHSFLKILACLLLILTVITSIKPVGTVNASAPDNYQWISHNNGMSALTIDGLAVDPSNENTLYALTDGMGVYKSSDGGTNWTAANTGMPMNLFVRWGNLYGNLLTIDSHNPQTLYANIGGVVYKTTNGASSWARSDSGISYSCEIPGTAGVIIDPADSLHLYAASVESGCSGGIFESYDGGSSWTQIAGAGGPAGNGDDYNDAWPLAIDPTSNSNMYFATVHEENMRSTDGGNHWSAMSFPGQYNGSDGEDIAINSSTHRILIGTGGGLVYSTNDGQTWNYDITFSGKSVTAIQFAPSDPTIAYLLTGNGQIYKSVDGGITWGSIYSSTISWRSLAISNSNPDHIFLGSIGQGVYNSTDGGATLTQEINGLPSSISIESLQFSPSEPNIYYAFVRGVGYYKSIDRGLSWQALGSKNSAGEIFVVDPKNSNLLYSHAYSDGYYKSVDGGLTWNNINIPGSVAIGSFTIDPANSDILYAADSTGVTPLQLFKSTDGGLNWVKKNNFPNGGNDVPVVEQFLIDPANTSNLYVATYDSFYKSVDAGDSWTKVTNGIPQNSADNWINTIAIDQENPNILYMGGRNAHIFKSTDSGDSWQQTSFNLDGWNVYYLTTDYTQPETIYAFGAMGWYQSTDAGLNWSVLPNTNGTFGSASPVSTFQDPLDNHRFISSEYIYGPYIYENSIPIFATSTLAVSNNNGSSNYHPGDTLNFSMTIKNSGFASATSPVVSVSLPLGLSFVPGSETSDGAAIPDSLSGNEVRINTSSLMPGDQIVLTFKTIVDNDISNLNLSLAATVTSQEDVSGTTISGGSINITPTQAPAGPSVNIATLPATGTDQFLELKLVLCLILLTGVGIYSARRSKAKYY